MPTISTNAIENFDSMTAEQKVEALLKVEIPEAVDLTGYVKKSLLDAKLSELAKAKDELKTKLTEDEKRQLAETEAKAAEAQRYADLEAKYNELAKKTTIAEYKANYLSQGYDEKLAADTAEALADGNMAKVFENAAKFKTALEAKIKSELMDKTPKPGGGSGVSADPHVEQAKAIGKAKADTSKTTEEVLSHYIKT